MSEVLKFVVNKKANKKVLSGYNWNKELQVFEQGRSIVIPVEAISQSLLVDMNEAIKEGVRVEVTVHDYDNLLRNVEIRWFGVIDKVAGFRVLVQWAGCPTKCWINMLSKDIHSLGNAARIDPEMKRHAYVPPKSLISKNGINFKDFVSQAIDTDISNGQGISSAFDAARLKLNDSKFRVGQRLELLDYNLSTQVRVAKIKEIRGRRVNVVVTNDDYPGDIRLNVDDRQADGDNPQYWIDQDCFVIFPVGWATFNGYKIKAKREYIEHTKRIVKAIKSGKQPKYHKDDLTFENLDRKPQAEKMEKLKVGMKFELLDPLAQQFQKLSVASILKFCATEGYLIVGMDGPDAMGDSFPIHIDNTFMFPVGYAEKYKLPLEPPEGFEGEFKWDLYLEKEAAETVPLNVFREEPSPERMAYFQKGAHIEAADMCENSFICPAQIKSVHGRLVYVNFDGWDAEFDELYDVDSHDILPLGWCEANNYPLQDPK